MIDAQASDFSHDRVFARAHQVLVATYGPDFQEKLGSQSAREAIARKAIEKAYHDNRNGPEGGRLEEFAYGKKDRMIVAIGRVLEHMRMASILHDQTLAQKLEADKARVRKAADAWRNSDPNPARGLHALSMLREAAEQDGHSLARGQANFRLWRYPFVVPQLQSAKTTLPAFVIDHLFAEEWPMDAGFGDVIRSLLDRKSFVRADHVLCRLEGLDALDPSGHPAEAIRNLRASFDDRLASEARDLVIKARAPTRDFALPGLHEKAMRLGETEGLYAGERLSATDVQDLAQALHEAAGEIRDAVQRQDRVLTRDGVQLDDTLKAVLDGTGLGSWRMRLAFARSLGTTPIRLEPAPMHFARSGDSVLRKLRAIDIPENVDTGKQAHLLGLHPTPPVRAFLRAAEFALNGNAVASAAKCATFIRPAGRRDRCAGAGRRPGCALETARRR